MSRDMPDKGAQAIQVLKGNMYVAFGMSTSSASVSIDALKTLTGRCSRCRRIGDILPLVRHGPSL
jgi:hypothetical protein